MNRRTAIALLLTPPLLAACGFRLRGAARFSFRRLYLGFAEGSALGAELRRMIRLGSDTEVVTDPGLADAVLEVLGEQRGKQILSLTAQGLVREYRLTSSLRFRLHDGKGKELLAPTEIALSREVSFNDAAILAKEAEDVLLYRNMQSDIAQQVVRRLAAVKVS